MAENTFLKQVKKSILKFADKENKEKDFVIEQGKSDFWNYRKWNSGIAECWGTATATINTAPKAWGSIFYFTPTIYKNFPSGLFVDNNIICYQDVFSSDMVLMSYTEGVCKKTQTYGIVPYRPSSGNLTSGNTSITLRAIGKWK